MRNPRRKGLGECCISSNFARSEGEKTNLSTDEPELTISRWGLNITSETLTLISRTDALTHSTAEISLMKSTLGHISLLIGGKYTEYSSKA